MLRIQVETMSVRSLTVIQGPDAHGTRLIVFT